MNERKTSKKAGYPNGDARDFFLRDLDGKPPPIMAVYAAPVVKEKK